MYSSYFVLTFFNVYLHIFYDTQTVSCQLARFISTISIVVIEPRYFFLDYFIFFLDRPICHNIHSKLLYTDNYLFTISRMS